MRAETPVFDDEEEARRGEGLVLALRELLRACT